MSCCQNLPSRRTFLAASGLATTAITMSACASEPEQEHFSGGEMTRAVASDDLSIGEAIQLAVAGTQLLLYRESDQTIHAFSAVCTHQGCIVGVGQNEPTAPFVCPCHASNFDKTSGAAIAGPASLPLTRHATSFEDGWILVEVETAD